MPYSHHEYHCLKSSASKLLFGTIGIYSTFFTSAVIHQKILKTPYQSLEDPSKHAYFMHPVLLTVLPSLFGWLLAASTNTFNKQKTYIRQFNLFKTASLFFISLMTLNQAIMLVNFPLVIMVKSCNILSVIFVGVFCTAVKDEGTKLGKDKIVIGVLMSLGILIFSQTGDAPQETSAHEEVGKGMMFLLISLIADGFLPDCQAEIKSKFKPRPLEMYERVNRWIFLISVTYMILTNQVVPIVQFVSEYPTVILDLISEAITNCVGQMFAYYLLNHFRQHVVPFIFTTRKILSGIISIVVYKHSVNKVQWLGLSLVAVSLITELSSSWILAQWRKYKETRKYSII